MPATIGVARRATFGAPFGGLLRAVLLGLAASVISASAAAQAWPTQRPGSMTTTVPRDLPKTTALFVKGAPFPPVHMTMLEGHGSAGHVELKLLMVGDDMVLVEIFE